MWFAMRCLLCSMVKEVALWHLLVDAHLKLFVWNLIIIKKNTLICITILCTQIVETKLGLKKIFLLKFLRGKNPKSKYCK